MAKRKVFGRRTSEFEERDYIIEMREDGLYVRRKHYREECKVSFKTLLQYTKPQLELNLRFNEPMDESKQEGPLPDMSQGLVVHSEPENTEGHMHEGSEQIPKAVPGWTTGMAPSITIMPDAANAAGTTTATTDDQLPKDN